MNSTNTKQHDREASRENRKTRRPAERIFTLDRRNSTPSLFTWRV